MCSQGIKIKPKKDDRESAPILVNLSIIHTKRDPLFHNTTYMSESLSQIVKKKSKQNIKKAKVPKVSTSYDIYIM